MALGRQAWMLALAVMLGLMASGTTAAPSMTAHGGGGGHAPVHVDAIGPHAAVQHVGGHASPCRGKIGASCCTMACAAAVAPAAEAAPAAAPVRSVAPRAVPRPRIITVSPPVEPPKPHA